MGASQANLAALQDGKPVCVVVGGGYGGVATAKELDKTGRFNVILIDRKNYFLHNVAALRATLDNSVVSKILVPYDRLLTSGVVLHGEVTEITDKAVHLHGTDRVVPFDYLVVALGSSYAFPAKLAEPTRDGAAEKYTSLASLLGEKQNVAIIGGGPVGIELAGEIATEMPDKQITLVHSGGELMHREALAPSMKQKLLKQLRSKNITVLLNQRVDFSAEQLQKMQGSTSKYIEGPLEVTTQLAVEPSSASTSDTGEVCVTPTRMVADILFMCTGSKLNNRALQPHFADKLNPQGRLMVDEFLRVRGSPNIFAVGDICDVAESKLAYLAGKHAKVVATNIQALHKGKALKTKYSPGPPAMFVTVGRHLGAGQLPMGGMVVGPKVVSRLKGSHMFTAEYTKLLNYDKREGEKTAEKNEEVRAMNLAAAMEISAAEAAQLKAGGLETKPQGTADYT